MLAILLTIVGFTAGLAAAPMLLPIVQARFPALAKFIRRMPATIAAPSLRANIDATIADLEAQVRNRVDVDRNMTRLAQLREVLGGE